MLPGKMDPVFVSMHFAFDFVVSALSVASGSLGHCVRPRDNRGAISHQRARSLQNTTCDYHHGRRRTIHCVDVLALGLLSINLYNALHI